MKLRIDRRSYRAALALGLTLLAGVSRGAEPKTIEITIERFAFTPAQVEAAPGDVLIFVNKDLVPHIASAVDGSWSTKDIPRGVSERVTVPANGSGTYFCRYHPAMRAQLTVKKAD